jgi:hypothetical protein
MKELASICRQAGLDVAQGFAPGQLREGHDAEQIGAAKRAHTCVATVSLDNAAKCLPRHKLHNLRKQRLAHVHVLPRVVQTRQDRKCRFRNSNRGHPRNPRTPLQQVLSSLPLSNKPDTTEVN